MTSTSCWSREQCYQERHQGCPRVQCSHQAGYLGRVLVLEDVEEILESVQSGACSGDTASIGQNAPQVVVDGLGCSVSGRFLQIVW